MKLISKKPFSLSIILTCILLVIQSPATAQTLFTIRIPCRVGEQVTAELPQGTLIPLGKVLKLPDDSRWPSYTASKWEKPGHVCASAVNAIHILQYIENDRGSTFSILPRKTIAPAAGKSSYILLDSPAGRGLFGAWAPYVGTAVTILRPDGSTIPAGREFLPHAGDTLLMKVIEHPDSPFIVDIENRVGGRLILWRLGKPHLYARVLRPLKGSGRFGGTKFQGNSRLRANHPGVIDISTSPQGLVGGFQIIPFEHAKSPEMKNLWKMAQWMVIARINSEKLVGTPPLFSGNLIPGPQKGEWLWDLWSSYGRKTLVLCRIDGGKWQRLPLISGRRDEAMSDITHIRIYFPFTQEPLTR